jgi:hypothetical protein
MAKPLVTYIKFRAPFPRVKGESDDAPGADLVRVISERLADLGIIVSAVTHTGGWKWKIHARIGRVKVSTLVGIVDEFIPGPVNQWNAMHYSNLRLPWKLLPYSIYRNRHIEDHEHYCKPFCEIVDSIAGLGDVIWYNTTSMGIRNAEATSD